MLLKSHNKSGVVCWSNSKSNNNLLACASYDQNDQKGSTLQILSLDVAQRSKELSVLASTGYQEEFRCIAWDNFGEKQGTYPYGLIFGGMEDGSFTIWNVNDMVSASRKGKNEEEILGLVHMEDPVLEYPILCAQWNSLKPNLLAYGSSEVLIIDIGKGFEQIQIVKPGQKNPHKGSYITDVCWNKEIAHILASASGNGIIALWDIKTNTSIFQLKETSSANTNRNVSVCWNKKIITQIAVTHDDQFKKQLQIWDLRNQKGPIISIDKGHTRGINCMDWSDSDPELILTSGRDNKVICWNYVREEKLVSEMQLNEEIIDLRWAKKLPAIYSIGTQSKLQIYSLNDNNLFSYVPKWYKVPVGTTHGPDNKILSFNENSGHILTQYSLKSNARNQQIEDLKSLIKTGANSSFYQQKASRDQNSDFWTLIDVLATSNVDNEIYNYLGLNKDKIIKQVEKYTGKKHMQETTTKNPQNKPKNIVNFVAMDFSEAENFFDNIGKASQVKKEIDQQEEDYQQNIQYDNVARNSNWNLGKQRIIKQNLLIGNYGGAIDAALKCGRTAQALIIAYSQGQDIFKSTLKTFFTETTDNFITDILRHIANKQIEQLVQKHNLNQWKECVALIYSLVRDQRGQLLKVLATRLINEQNQTQNALICLILAEDFQEVLKLITKLINEYPPKSKNRKVTILREVQRLIAISQVITKNIAPSKIYDKILIESAMLCYDQGQTTLAFALLSRANVAEQKINNLLAFMDINHQPGKYFHHVMNLPVMPKRKQNKQVVNKKVQPQQKQPNKNSVGNKFNPRLEEAPLNPPPPPVRQKQPIFSKEPEEVKNLSTFNPTSFNPNTPSNIHVNNPPINPNKSYHLQEKKIPPPPPPIVKIQPTVKQENNAVSSSQNSATKNPNNPPPPPKKLNTPPPPPPRVQKVVQPIEQQNINKSVSYSNSNNPNNFVSTKTETQIPPQKKLPPPPPPIKKIQQPIQQQPVNQKPPMRLVQQQPVQTSSYQQPPSQYTQQTTIVPPPSTVKRVPPPPPRRN